MAEVVEWGIQYPGEDRPHPTESEWRARSWARYWNEHRDDEGGAFAVSRLHITTDWTATPPTATSDPAGMSEQEA